MSDTPDFSAMGRHELEARLRAQFLKEGAEAVRAESLYSAAIETFGSESRMRLMQEECAELIAAISQFSRGRVGVLALADELADVEIMCGQLRLIVGWGAVESAKQSKLERLTNRVERGTDV